LGVAGSDRGGRAREMQEFSHLLMIQHADGTLGEYLHLQKNGVLVKVGDEVKAGELVARSGNTGCSTGPHLHFHVRQPLDGSTWRSVPVRFWTTEAAVGNRGGRRAGEPRKTEVLTKGVRYTATRGAESMRQAEESRPLKGSPAPPERS
jgi:murein DD-endopeptidase MepM/ murein hydrolase activator NlpD